MFHMMLSGTCYRINPWNMFLMVQLTISQYWFKWWLGAKQATSHYLNQWWPSLLTHACVSRWVRWVRICTGICHVQVNWPVFVQTRVVNKLLLLQCPWKIPNTQNLIMSEAFAMTNHMLLGFTYANRLWNSYLLIIITGSKILIR